MWTKEQTYPGKVIEEANHARPAIVKNVCEQNMFFVMTYALQSYGERYVCACRFSIEADTTGRLFKFDGPIKENHASESRLKKPF